MKTIFEMTDAEKEELKYKGYCVAPSCAYTTSKETYPYCAYCRKRKENAPKE